MTAQPAPPTMYQPQLFGGEHVEVAENTDSWCTPESELGSSMFGLAYVRLFYSGTIDLDPCSNPRSTVGALATHTLADDGLSQRWRGRRVWVNPPYSDCGPWLERCGEAARRGAEALALPKGDWSTQWWQDHVRTATARCELSKRVSFVTARASTTAPFPSVLVYWGPRVDDFTRVFGPLGEVIRGEALGLPMVGGGS